MSFFIFSALINAIISTILGLFVYWKNRREKLNQTFAVFCLSTAVWSYGYYFWQIASTAESAYFWCRFLMMGAIFITVTYLHFTFVLLKKEYKKNLFLTFSYLLFFSFFVVNLFTNKIVSHVEPVLNFQFWPIAGSLFSLFLFFWVAYALYAAILLFNEFLISSGQERRKLAYILVGTVIGYAGGITNYFLWYHIPILPLGNISTAFYLAIVAYAIVKYNLMNIKVIATQILAGGLVIVTILELFNADDFNELMYKAVVVIVTIFFAVLIIRSVLDEVRRREAMEELATKLAKVTKHLQKANRELKQLDEAKSTFISIASHQLRTPLTAIKGYGSMLLEGDFGEIKEKRQHDAINKMFVSNDRLISLVENLLNISRIESGRIKFLFKPASVDKLVEDTCKNLENNAKTEGLYLKYNKPVKPLPEISIDEEKIRQVIINFVDNAIKYTKKGGITVDIYKKGSDIECCVKDTGIGITTETKAKLFKKFSRGKNAFAVNTEGTGLGLYVAHMMVDGHQGKVWVDSDGENKGSKFSFSIPIKRTQASAGDKPANKPLKNKEEK